jgi:TolB-like protein/Tfp pilus assembly protein PilF
LVATSLLGELKRRNVFRAAALYAAAAWLLVQVAIQVSPFFHVADWAVRAIMVAALVGLPPFIAFAWYYELTPEGLKRQSEIDLDESIVHLTARKLDRGIIVLLGFIALLMLVDIFVLRKPAADAAATKAPATEASVANSAVVGTDSPAAGSANTAVSAKSIAVLPFENLSKEADNAYFATGMQDEILTRLAGIHDLKVISRTSTVQYASHPPNLKVVAEQLGVATVLEGSVQKAGEQVHINLQLIDAHNDSHLWAQSYNRELKDIFAVEAEVAQKVADALKAQLVPTETARVASVPTQNPVAYELYLRANSHANRAYDQDVLVPPELPPAITLYQQALGADPQFALAAAGLARAHMHMYFYAPDRTEKRLADAKTAADRALALQPGLGEAHHALALYHYWGYRDYAAAVEQLQLARQTMPNSADVVILLAAIERRQGRGAEAIAGFQQATLLDPRSSFALDQLAFTYSALRRYAEADRAFAQAVAVTRDPKDEQISLAINTVAWKGDVAPLRAALAALEPGSDAYTGNLASFYALHWWSRDYATALSAGHTSTDSDWSDQANIFLPRNLYLAWAHQAAGDAAKATESYSLVQKTASAALLQQPDVAELHLALAFANAGLGLKDEAIREGKRAGELLPVSRDALSGSSMQVWLAQLYVRVGDYDSAFDLLRPAMRQFSGQFFSPALLKLDPNWDPLRKNPRFEQLLALGSEPVDGTSAR